MSSHCGVLASLLAIFAFISIDSFFLRSVSNDRDNTHTINGCSQLNMGCLICSMRDKKYVQGRYQKRHRDTIKSHITSDTMNKAIFESIYNNSVWGSEGGGSGAGSDGTYAIGANYILHLVIYKYGLTSLLDAPCGAVSNSWTKPLITSLASEIPCFKYFGVDVVPSVIALNSAAFSSMDWANFGEVDLSSSDVEIPNGYDIILSRDALQHDSTEKEGSVVSPVSGNTNELRLMTHRFDP